MSRVFGPVPSRRLGRSLGVDPIPFKTCNWNCVYCQLGRSAQLKTERERFFPADSIVDEVVSTVERIGKTNVDWVTFVGSGEPTLHLDLGEMIREVKRRTDLPVAVITNGSLLYLEAVRRDLLEADAVLPTLDAGSERVYRRINRPARSLTFDRQIEGLRAFRREYRGQLWVEVMLVKGYNDDDQSLAEIAQVLEEVNPEEVHLNRPTRPAADARAEPSDELRTRRAAEILGAGARSVAAEAACVALSEHEELESAILGIVTRHPLEQARIADTLSTTDHAGVERAVLALLERGEVQQVERHGARFLCAGEGLFGPA